MCCPIASREQSKPTKNVLIISVILLDVKAEKTEMRELNVYKNQELFFFNRKTTNQNAPRWSQSPNIFLCLDMRVMHIPNLIYFFKAWI